MISITPRHNADAELTERLRGFHHELTTFDGKDLADVIEKANTVMGIRSGATKDDMNLPMFSDDILKIEISGPEQPHLTVIDVPGLFHVTDEGHTTDLDKLMVENMVQRYMENERTIVLAVLSCLSDRATETILQRAKAADPKGERTVGVLTKADLATEKNVLRGLLDVVSGNTLRLGYYVVCNRGADDDDLDIADVRRKEKERFARPEWAEFAKLNRVGVEALRTELQGLLTELAKRELPKQRAEVTKRLALGREQLVGMGAPRENAPSQREHLITLSSKFEKVVGDALEARYDGQEGGRCVFSEHPELKLITKIMDLNEGFSNQVWKKGQSRYFVDQDIKAFGDKPSVYECAVDDAHSSASSFPELRDIISTDTTRCEGPASDGIMKHIENCYRKSRGPELGTFGGALLAVTFREQARKWRSIVECHVRTVIVEVHSFIKTLLEVVIVDQRMREELWETVLLEKLLDGYRRAFNQADHLLYLELYGRPSTCNHYFNDNLQKARAQRLQSQVDKASTAYSGQAVTINKETLSKGVINKSNAEQVKEDMHDILRSYYKVSRKRFVDIICRQVIEHLLLDGLESPLKVLTPHLVAKMSESQLDRIAGEDAATRRERKRLEKEIKGLEAAMEVLRS